MLTYASEGGKYDTNFQFSIHTKSVTTMLEEIERGHRKSVPIANLKNEVLDDRVVNVTSWSHHH